jgi:uncharacterized membrane protein YebE (DUF533 family)
MTAKTLLLASALIASSAGLAMAGSSDSWRQKQIDASQARATFEIEKGRYQGELTRREYRATLAEQERIAAMERAAKADGHISKREFRDIREAQADAQVGIAAETHDRQKSFWRRFLYLNRF